MNKATLHFEAIFKLEPEGGYTVTIPTLSGCITYGKSIHEATKMAKDAIVGYLHVLHNNRTDLV